MREPAELPGMGTQMLTVLPNVIQDGVVVGGRCAPFSRPFFPKWYTRRARKIVGPNARGEACRKPDKLRLLSSYRRQPSGK